MAVRVRVTGLVHGVSFRAGTAEMAGRFGVSGWVRNVDDGSVEAFLEGDELDVSKVVQWARRGPPMARVSSLEAIPTTPVGLRRFKILAGSEAF